MRIRLQAYIRPNLQHVNVSPKALPIGNQRFASSPSSSSDESPWMDPLTIRLNHQSYLNPIQSGESIRVTHCAKLGSLGAKESVYASYCPEIASVAAEDQVKLTHSAVLGDIRPKPTEQNPTPYVNRLTLNQSKLLGSAFARNIDAYKSDINHIYAKESAFLLDTTVHGTVKVEAQKLVAKNCPKLNHVISLNQAELSQIPVIGHLETQGTLVLNNCKVQGHVKAGPNSLIHSSQIAGTLSARSNYMVLQNSTVHDVSIQTPLRLPEIEHRPLKIKLTRYIPAPQYLLIDKSSTVKGDITFMNGGGYVIAERGAKIIGDIINGHFYWADSFPKLLSRANELSQPPL